MAAASAPRRPGDHPFAARERSGTVRAIAHRGGGGELENTVAAFADAVELGYLHLETDVHATVDGVLVVSHDPTLERVTGHPRPIATMTAAEVAALRVAGREPVPTLDELVTTFPTARFTVDLKHDQAVAPMLRLLEARPALLDRLCLGSFSTGRVTAVRDAFGPRAYTAAAQGEVLRLIARSRAGRRPLARGADCIAVPEAWPLGPLRIPVLAPGVLAAAQEAGLDVHVWTVNEPDPMRRLVAAGVDGIVTDELALLRDVLVDAGRWEGSGPS